MKKILLAIPEGKTLRLLNFHFSKRGWYVLLAHSGDKARQLAREEQPEMVIADSSLPRQGRYGLCQHIREDSSCRQPFVILLTSSGERASSGEDLERGADDYLPRPVDPQKTVLRVEHLMRRNMRKEGHNVLTGLPHLDMVKKEIKRFIDWEEQFALCAVNLNYFRAYNEVYGFDVGDRAIRKVADILLDLKTRVKPKQFYLGHLVADKFLLLLSPDRLESYCQGVIEHFQRIRSSMFTQSDLQRGHLVTTDKTGRMRRFALLSISIGVVTGESASFSNEQQAIDTALWALHKAKARWGNNYYVRKDGPMGLVAARNNEECKKILVVDEDAVYARLLKSKLEREGYDVRTTAGGPEVVEVIRQDPPDLIFVDDRAEHNGCQTASWLKRDIRAAVIPLVLSISSADMEGARLSGVDDCLVKPYSFKYLMSKLEEHLEHH